MKKLIFALLFTCFTALSLSPTASAQIYTKLNGLYALAGVINPSVEFTLSKHSSIQAELVYSPWQAIRFDDVNRPMTFIYQMTEYRRYFKQTNHGWYVGANAGIMAFNITKPIFVDGKFGFKPTSGKGYSFLLGVVGGYEWIFAKKWILDAYFGWAWMNSHYNPYALVDGVVEGGHIYNKGDCVLTPGATLNTTLDPFNGSGEWLPNKIGVSIGVLIFDPHKQRNKVKNQNE